MPASQHAKHYAPARHPRDLMKATRLTLICHALTQAQKTGRLHCADDGILPLSLSCQRCNC